MPSEYEASILKQSCTSNDNRRLRRIALGIGVIFIGASLIHVTAWSQATRFGAHADMTPFSGASQDNRTGVSGGARVPLFLGYVEFDWDPDGTGGVPGFGPSPPTALITDVVVARPVEN